MCPLIYKKFPSQKSNQKFFFFKTHNFYRIEEKTKPLIGCIHLLRQSLGRSEKFWQPILRKKFFIQKVWEEGGGGAITNSLDTRQFSSEKSFSSGKPFVNRSLCGLCLSWLHIHKYYKFVKSNILKMYLHSIWLRLSDSSAKCLIALSCMWKRKPQRDLNPF